MTKAESETDSARDHEIDDQKTSQDAVVPASSETAVSTTHRIGRWQRFLIILSLFIILGALVFISWLWCWPNGYNWRRIFFSRYANISVTLSALLLRAAIAITAGISTSMIAAISLEEKGVPLQDAAQLSISRYTSSGPISLFLLLFGPTFTWSLRIIASALIITTITSQFLSTILFADFGPVHVLSFPNVTDIAFKPGPEGHAWHDPNPTQNFQSYMYGRISSSPIFAEYSETVETSEDTDDTGVAIRALLPIASQADREMLQNFAGVTRVFDARVICTRPPGMIELRGCPTHMDNSIEQDPQGRVSRICGKFSGFSGSTVGDEGNTFWAYWQQAMAFSCPVYPSLYSADRWGNTAHCSLFWNASYMSPFGETPTPLREETRSIFQEAGDWPNGGIATLLLDYGEFVNDTADTSYAPTIYNTTTFTFLDSSGSGPWTDQWLRYEYEDEAVDLLLKATVCFDSFGENLINHLNITASSGQALREPSYVWDSTNERLNADGPLTQLGGTLQSLSQSHDERNVMTMSRDILETSLEDMRRQLEEGDLGDIPLLDSDDWINNLTSFTETKYFGAMSFDSLGADVPGTQILDLYYDTLRETDSPARAIQAYKTSMMRTIYYDYLDTFTATGTASLSRFESKLAPKYYRGYTTAMVITIVHVLLFLYLLNRFLRTTRSSLLDNAWHTIAQVAEGPEMFDALRKARLASDSEISILLAGPKERSKGDLRKRRRSREQTRRVFVSDDGRIRPCEEDMTGSGRWWKIKHRRAS